MKKILLWAAVFALLSAAHANDRLDHFYKTGKIRTIDTLYEVHKLNPEAGSLHVDYSDKAYLVKTRLKETLAQMDAPTRENYLKTIPEGGYLTLFIPRPVVTAPEVRWFLFEVFDEEGNTLSKGRSNATLDVGDSAGEGKSRWIAVQTIALPKKVTSKLTVEVVGETCAETQRFVITRL